jgi:hypothetical protein
VDEGDDYARGTEPGQIVKLELVPEFVGKRDWHSLLIASLGVCEY